MPSCVQDSYFARMLELQLSDTVSATCSSACATVKIVIIYPPFFHTLFSKFRGSQSLGFSIAFKQHDMHYCEVKRQLGVQRGLGYIHTDYCCVYYTTLAHAFATKVQSKENKTKV